MLLILPAYLQLTLQKGLICCSTCVMFAALWKYVTDPEASEMASNICVYVTESSPEIMRVKI